MLTHVTSLILAQAAPAVEPTTDVVQWGLSLVKWIAEQFASKNYAAAIAGIVMAAVFLVKLFLKDKLSSDALPLVSAGIGLVLSLAGALAGAKADMSATSIMSIVLSGLTTGAMASGFWSLLGKRLVDFVKSKFSKAPTAPSEPAKTEEPVK